MLSEIEGRVWKFGDNIDTDLMIKGKYINAKMEEIAEHVFETINPSFSKEVMPGDIIIAGRYFGCGSSREVAAASFKYLKVGCIIAESYGRIFFRNSIAIGLPAISCPGVADSFKTWDNAKVDFDNHLVINLTSGKELPFNPFPKEMLQILEIGGMESMLRKLGEG